MPTAISARSWPVACRSGMVRQMLRFHTDRARSRLRSTRRIRPLHPVRGRPLCPSSRRENRPSPPALVTLSTKSSSAPICTTTRNSTMMRLFNVSSFLLNFHVLCNVVRFPLCLSFLMHTMPRLPRKYSDTYSLLNITIAIADFGSIYHSEA